MSDPLIHKSVYWMSALKIEWWLDYVHSEQRTLTFLLNFLRKWPRFRHRKQRDADFNFSVRSLTLVNSLQSSAEWPLFSQNTQNGSCRPFCFRTGGLVDFVWTWKATVVEVRESRPVTSPRIFRVIIAQSNSSFKQDLSFVMYPSESWSRFA